MAVVRIEAGHGAQDVRIQMLPVAELGLVNRLIHPGLNQPRRIGGGVDHHIIARVAGHELGVHNIGGVVDVIVDLDAELLFEIGQSRRPDVVRPVVDVDDLLRRGRPVAGGAPQRQQRHCQGSRPQAWMLPPAHVAIIPADSAAIPIFRRERKRGPSETPGPFRAYGYWAIIA